MQDISEPGRRPRIQGAVARALEVMCSGPRWRRRIARRRGRLGLAVGSGTVVAGLLTVFVATVRHAALMHNAPKAPSPAATLADGFTATFLFVAVLVLVVLTILNARLAAREARALPGVGQPEPESVQDRG